MPLKVLRGQTPKRKPQKFSEVDPAKRFYDAPQLDKDLNSTKIFNFERYKSIFIDDSGTVSNTTNASTFTEDAFITHAYIGFYSTNATPTGQVLADVYVQRGASIVFQINRCFSMANMNGDRDSFPLNIYVRAGDVLHVDTYRFNHTAGNFSNLKYSFFYTNLST